VLSGKRLLLIVSGGIAAYKSLDLVRRLKERGIELRCILTAGGAEFVTPLSLSSLSGEKVYEDLFSLTDESKMGHIRLARDANLIVVAPASADFLAKMAGGLAGDLASAVLLTSDSPVLVAPAMNVAMWEHAATRSNMALLEERGVRRVGPEAGNLACGEVGEGRMAEVAQIITAIEKILVPDTSLAGRHALVTSGPTHEPIDPVRYIANRSSGKQGHAIAGALARMGAETTLVSGPTNQPDPEGVNVQRVETALQMFAICQAALPVDVAVCAAAVGDWKVNDLAYSKLKKSANAPPVLALSENPDILASLSQAGNLRPALVVGFAAETENVAQQAAAKRKAKGCDWILANDVSHHTGTFGGDENTVQLIDGEGAEDWPTMTKLQVAECLARRIAYYFSRAA
jgi:phosphopantothenoylcysteine decarboxylase/phosphopantothenate--cysteine ligase